MNSSVSGIVAKKLKCVFRTGEYEMQRHWYAWMLMAMNLKLLVDADLVRDIYQTFTGLYGEGEY